MAPETVDDQEGGEAPRLQEPQPDLRHEVELLRGELASLRERVEAVEGQAAQERGRGDDYFDVDDVDAGDEARRQWTVAPPWRVFPELITEEPEPGEDQVYGAAAEVVVEWRNAWAERKSAGHAARIGPTLSATVHDPRQPADVG